MPTKLRNLKIKRVAFVDEGANPEAHMKFAKRKPDDAPANIDDGKITAEEATNILKRFAEIIGKAFKWNDSPIEVVKDAHTFDEVEATRKADEILCKNFYPMLSALSDSVYSILHDVEKSGEAKKALLDKTLSQFSEAFKSASDSWAGGDVSEDIVVKSMESVVATRDRLTAMIEKSGEDAPTDTDPAPNETGEAEPEPTTNDGNEGDPPDAVQKGEHDMKFNVEAMSAEERTQFEDLKKRFGSEDEGQNPAPAGEPAPAPAPAADPVEEPAGDDMYKGLSPALRAEIDSLRKYREAAEAEKLLNVAKRYTLLGHDPEKLAKSLKSMKDAGGDVYDQFVAGLDAALNTVEKSGMFDEIGKRGGNSVNGEDAWKKIEVAAAEIQKSKPTMAWHDAINEACVQHPELVNEYEKSRR